MKEVVNDQKDKRIKRLYLTGQGIPAIKRIKEIHRSFYQTLCFGLSAEDIRQCEQTIEQMMENVNQKVWHRMEDHHGD